LTGAASGAGRGPSAGSRSFGSPPITVTLTAPAGCCLHPAGASASADKRRSAGKRRIAARLIAMAYSASVGIYGFSCFTHVKHWGESGNRCQSPILMAARDGIWSRGGMPVEELPDPFEAEPAIADRGAVPEPGTVSSEPEPPRKR